MNTLFTFNDMTLIPKYSVVKSREECDTSIYFDNTVYQTPIMSANMDTITGVKMAKALNEAKNIAIPALHRFCSIDDNVDMFKNSGSKNTWCSIGTKSSELERFAMLLNAGALNFVIDIANGQSDNTFNLYKGIMSLYNPFLNVIVGNFSHDEPLKVFLAKCEAEGIKFPYGVKVGVGGGSNCITREVTGMGYPQASAVHSVKKLLGVGNPVKVISDGGHRTVGDICKALVLGADVVMLGNMLSGTDQTPGDVFTETGFKVDNVEAQTTKLYKHYKGSASLDSYKKQDKVAAHRTPEGISRKVPYSGDVINIIQAIQAGIRSSMSYSNVYNLRDYKALTRWERISTSSYLEGTAHGVH